MIEQKIWSKCNLNLLEECVADHRRYTYAAAPRPQFHNAAVIIIKTFTCWPALDCRQKSPDNDTCEVPQDLTLEVSPASITARRQSLRASRSSGSISIGGLPNVSLLTQQLQQVVESIT